MTEKIDIPNAKMVAVSELKPHPRNYRGHPEDQIEHLEASIREHGFYRNVVVARDGVVLAGHGVVEASRKLKIDEIPVTRLDIDSNDPRALKVMAGDNAIANLAIDDERALTELLKELNQDHDLLGTGFDEQMLANLAMVTRPRSEIADFDEAAEWVGMPDYEPGEKRIQISVTFDTEEGRESFAKQIGIETMPDQRPVWSVRWPLREREDPSSVIFEG